MTKLIDRIPKVVTGPIRIKHTKTTGESVVIVANDEPETLPEKPSSRSNGFDSAEREFIVGDMNSE